MDVAVTRRRFAEARHARLATVTADGRPHLVPITFALLPGTDVVVTAVDHKPKRTLALARLRNIAANPAVSLLVDEYTEDWSALWWVRADGLARLLTTPADRADPLAYLAAKYPPYRAHPPPGPVIHIQVHTWRTWSARPKHR